MLYDKYVVWISVYKIYNNLFGVQDSMIHFEECPYVIDIHLFLMYKDCLKKGISSKKKQNKISGW